MNKGLQDQSGKNYQDKFQANLSIIEETSENTNNLVSINNMNHSLLKNIGLKDSSLVNQNPQNQIKKIEEAKNLD